MGNLVGVQGGGNLSEQLKLAGASTVAGTEPAAGTPFLSPASQAGTFQTGGVDRQGANSALLRVMNGAVTAAALWTVKIQHSNDDGVTDSYTDLSAVTGSQAWTNTTTGFLASPTSATSAVATANTDYFMGVDLRQAKKWIRVDFILVSGTSSYLAADLILGAYDTLPTTDF